PPSPSLLPYTTLFRSILGVRSFNVNKNIAQVQTKLLDYVQGGGTVLTQYNVSNGLVSKNFGPYAFSLGRNRVTDELAPVHYDERSEEHTSELQSRENL